MNEKAEKSLFLTLDSMQGLLIRLERQVNAAERLLQNSYPEVLVKYREALRSVESEAPSVSQQYLETVRQEVFQDRL
ncbi:MAG: hypothetical protein ABSA85_07910 [Terracidiphilus sp.]|jgi:hypothetical protein